MEELIGAVKKHRALWDITATSYKDHSKRLQAWNLVSEQCGLTLESAKSKWRGLRDTYIKFLKAQKRTTDQGRIKRKKYCYAEQMAFMKPLMLNIKSRPRVTKDPDISVSSDVWEDVNIELLPPPFVEYEQQDPTEYPPEKRFKQIPDTKHEAFEVSWKNQSTDGEMDATDMLFLSYSKTVKTFTKRRQIFLKRKIAEIFSEAELEQVTEEEAEFASASFISTMTETNECKSEPV